MLNAMSFRKAFPFLVIIQCLRLTLSVLDIPINAHAYVLQPERIMHFVNILYVYLFQGQDEGLFTMAWPGMLSVTFDLELNSATLSIYLRQI